MIPTDKRAQLIRYQDMFTASHINKSSRSYEVRKSFNNQTNRYAGTVSFLLKQNIKDNQRKRTIVKQNSLFNRVPLVSANL